MYDRLFQNLKWWDIASYSCGVVFCFTEDHSRGLGKCKRSLNKEVTIGRRCESVRYLGDTGISDECIVCKQCLEHGQSHCV